MAGPETATAPGAPALVTPPLWRRFAVFLGPLVLTNVLQALAGTFNNVYLGHMIGPQALAAAYSFFPLLMLCLSFVIGLGTGASILVGQAWGAKNVDKVREVAGTVLVGGATLGVVVAAIGLACVGRLLPALGTPPDLLPQAVPYARVLLLALPVLFVSMLAASVLRGMGDTVTPLLTLVVTCCVSFVATPALIAGWGGLPRAGVASAAWATLLAHLAALAWLAWRLARRKHAVAPRQLRGHWHFNGPVLRQVVRLGVPTGLFFVTGSLADIGLLSLVNQHGASAVAAWAAVAQVMAYIQFPAISIAIAAGVLAAQAIGAKQTGEVAHVARVGVGMNLALTGSLAVLVALAAPLAMGVFVTDAGVIRLGATLLLVSVWGSVLFGIASVFSGVMRAAGTVRVPTLISLACLAFLLYPLGWLFGRWFGLPGIWLAYPVTYGCGMLLQGAYYFLVFRHKPIEALRF
jgi:putative MATE family efflux protein